MSEMELLEQTLNDIVRDIRDNLAATGTNASGRTSDSLAVEMYAGGGMVTGRPYFQSVEKGTPPGPQPLNFPMIIRRWMDDKAAHGFNVPSDEREAMNMAFAISRKIQQRGSLLFRNGGRTDIYTDIINERMEELEKKLSIKYFQLI